MKDQCKSEIYLCSCNGEGIKVEKWNKDEIYMAFWKQGLEGRNPLSLKERVRWIWNILTTGRVWADEVILRENTARLLGKYLLSISEEDKMTQESEPLYYKTCLYCNNFIKAKDTLCPVCGANQID